MERIGWKMGAPTVFLDHRGTKVDLCRHSPALVKAMLRAANQRQLQMEAGAKLWKGAKNARLCPDTVERLLHSTKLDEAEKGIIKSISCKSYWTNHRRKACGYDVEDRCPLCGSEGDTLHHRIWTCQAPEVEQARARVLRRFKGEEPSVQDVMSGKGVSNPLAVQGVFPAPC